MKTLEVTLPEQTAERLAQAAEKMGVTAEELLRLSLEEKLAQLDRDFSTAANYVVQKNAELYKRLA